MSVDFDMGLRQPVSLQHMLKGEKKNSLFSGLADWPQDDILHKMPAMHKHGDKQKKLQCMYRRRSRQLTHSMRKILPVDIHTLHTTVCAYACVASQTRQMCQSFMTHCRLKKKNVYANCQQGIFFLLLWDTTHWHNTEKYSVPMAHCLRTLGHGLLLLARNMINHNYTWLWNKTWHRVLLKAIPGWELR